jgi:hypothetical protein
MVKEVAHIHFTRLTVLTLRDNDIDSIEELPLVSMPLIEHLNLGTSPSHRQQSHHLCRSPEEGNMAAPGDPLHQ